MTFLWPKICHLFYLTMTHMLIVVKFWRKKIWTIITLDNLKLLIITLWMTKIDIISNKIIASKPDVELTKHWLVHMLSLQGLRMRFKPQTRLSQNCTRPLICFSSLMIFFAFIFSSFVFGFISLCNQDFHNFQFILWKRKTFIQFNMCLLTRCSVKVFCNSIELWK